MTSFRPSVGDIWFACVEFSDHPGVGKVRPVVVDVQESRCTVVAAKVASKDLCSDGSGKCVPIIDWDLCGLRKPSYIRIDQKFELSFDKLLCDEPLGRLSCGYVQVIEAVLRL